ncbi:MAG: hypothetical protein ACTSP3_01275 [Candidatus Heimdallarchaeaceae archaeon]
MDEYRISLFQFLPVIEALWNECLREPLDFLQSNLNVSKVIYQSFKEKKHDIINNKILPFVPQVGRLSWDLNKDYFIYLRNLKYLIQDNQPIRPVIPLSTPTIKWKKIREVLKKSFNQNLIVRVYPNLIGEIEKNYSINCSFSADSFPNILEKSKEIFLQEQNQEKDRIMKAIFKETEGINLFLSDLLIIIESTVRNYQNLNLINSVFDTERIKGGWIKEIKHNYWLIIYGNPNPSKKLRERMKTAVKLPFMLRGLGRRIQYLLETGKEDYFSLKNKLSFYEFIISIINPDYYSSKDKFSFLLPKYYQRTIFSKIAELLQLEKLYSSIKNTIIKRIEKWEPYEQYSVLSKRNIVLNQLREELSIKFRKYPSLNLSKKEIVILSLFRKEFLNQLNKEGVSLRYIERQDIFAGRTKNFLVENIKNWLYENGYELDLISQTELKAPYPKLLKTLVDRDLLIKTPLSGKSGSYLYSLNLENEFIKKFVFEK